MEFYGFLHLEEQESSTVNVSVRSFRHKVLTYLQNAALLGRSLRDHGHEFHLLTNQRGLIDQLAPSIARELRLIEIEFAARVPSGVRFFSGHYKVDVFRYLGNLPKGYRALIDLDMLCVNFAPESLADAENNNTALYYDITEQVVASSGEAHLRDQLEEILGREVSLRWSGGEFLAGPPEFFAELTSAVDSIFDRYLEVSVGRYRVGNEPYQNAAIELLREKGWDVRDAGELGIVRRFWNMPVKHRQPPFRDFQNAFLLHLPVDKHILSLIYRFPPGSPEGYLATYRMARWFWLPVEIFQRFRGYISKRLSRQ